MYYTLHQPSANIKLLQNINLIDLKSLVFKRAEYNNITIMNKKKLIDAVENLSNQASRSPEEQFFIRMLKQVWQIDWSVAPSDVWRNLMARNQDYFFGFMELDDGDDKEEDWLIASLDKMVEAFIHKSTDSKWKSKIVDTIDELNQLRFKMQK